jgi:hypothetical protein
MDKDASTYTSLLFDFVATGPRTIQFLFLKASIYMAPIIFFTVNFTK